MNRAGLVALLTIGPLALGVCVLLLIAAAILKFFTRDEQKLARVAVEVAVTIAAGAAFIIALAQFVF